MILIFVLLELLANLVFQRSFGTITEISLHLALSFSLFGIATFLAAQNVRLSFVLNTTILFFCLLSYLVSYETEEALGVPLHFKEGLENLQRDPTLIVFFGDYLYAGKVAILIGLILSGVSLFLLFRIGKLLPVMTSKTTALLLAIGMTAILLVGIFHSKSLRHDTRLTFYFSWPTSIAPRGMERHLEMIDARDAQVRNAYQGSLKRAPTIVLIFADSLRADHFPQYGYHRETAPFLSSLSAASKLSKVEWAFSTCSDSFCGISTTFSSRKRDDVSENPLKFNELLAKAGYENWALVAGDHRKFDNLGVFYGSSFDHFLDFESYPNLSKNDDAIIREGLKQIPQAGDQPRFFYFFLMSSHVLGSKPKEARVFEPSDVRKFITKWHTTDFNQRLNKLGVEREDSLEAIINNYDNGLRAVDIEIRNIFETLSSKGYLEDALVFILGDHGDSLGEHNHLGHTYLLYNEDMRVPLFIYDTSGDDILNSFYVTQEDLAPTILERVGLPIPEFYSGYSLYSKERQSSLHQNEHRRSPSFAAIRRKDQALYKYMTFKEHRRVTENLFELTSDPQELHKLDPQKYGEVMQELRQDIQTLN